MKAILVMDMPKNCFKCKLQDWANCRIVKGCHTGDTRPDWCPLKPAPQKQDICGKYNSEYYAQGGKPASYKIGYNACIDEILGDKE